MGQGVGKNPAFVELCCKEARISPQSHSFIHSFTRSGSWTTRLPPFPFPCPGVFLSGHSPAGPSLPHPAVTILWGGCLVGEMAHKQIQL